MGATIRPYSPAESLHSDRSAGDRARHREKIREALRENIADVIAEQAIIGRSGDTIIKIPIRGIKEYRFVYGDNTPGVGEGDGDTQEGDVLARGNKPGQGQQGVGGNLPGQDYYETDVSLEEVIELMFEDLELPDLEQKALRQVLAQRTTRRRGYKHVGVRVHMDKVRTAKSRIRRKLAREHARRAESEPPPPPSGNDNRLEERFPYHREDLRFRRRIPDEALESNAVVFCLMDTSGSMDTMKKYLARSFFFLLYHFVRSRYDQVDVVFVAHDTTAREVSEEEFFAKGESGGTMISSGYQKLLEIIEERYHPSLWNVYAFHCSDGDNFPQDNETAIRLARELCQVCNLFGFGEIKPDGASDWGSGSLLSEFEAIEEPNFRALGINGRDEIWPCFKEFLSREEA